MTCGVSRSWFVVVGQALQPASPSPPCPARPDERLPDPTCLSAEPLEAQRINISGLPPPRLRMTALSSSGRHSSLHLLLRLALLARMNGSLIQPAYPLSLLRQITAAPNHRKSSQVRTVGFTPCCLEIVTKCPRNASDPRVRFFW